MDDDLGTPAALAAVHNTVREGNAALDVGDEQAARSAAGSVRAMMDVLGLDPLSAKWSELSAVDYQASAGTGLTGRGDARGAPAGAQGSRLRDRRRVAGPPASRGNHRRGHPRRSTVDSEGQLTVAGTPDARARCASQAPRRVPSRAPAARSPRACTARARRPRPTMRPGHPAQRRATAAAKARAGQAAPQRGQAARSWSPGRNPVVECLRAGVPATALYVALGVDADDRVTEAVRLAADRGISVLEVRAAELDRLTGGALHQGLALQVPPFEYAHPDDLLEAARTSGDAAAAGGARRRHRPAQPGRGGPLRRGLRRARRACCRSGAARGSPRSHGARQRGTAAKLPVAMATNLTRTLRDLAADRADDRRAGRGRLDHRRRTRRWPPHRSSLVVGSEGRGLSRLVRETCDATVSIPMAPEWSRSTLRSPPASCSPRSPAAAVPPAARKWTALDRPTEWHLHLRVPDPAPCDGWLG